MRHIATAVLIMGLVLALGWLFLPIQASGLHTFIKEADPSSPTPPNWNTGIGGILILVIGAVGAWLINWSKTRADIKGAQQTQAINEYKEYADRQEKDIARLQARADQQDQKIYTLQESEKDCLRRHAEAVEKLAMQNGMLDRLTSDIRRLQSITRDTHPGVTAPAIIIAAVDGTVLDANAAVGALLHWMPADLKGKNVEVLVPDRLRAKHRAGLEKLKAGEIHADPGKSIRAMALKRDGGEVEVVITLSAFKSPMGSQLVTAEIRQAPSPADDKAQQESFK